MHSKTHLVFVLGIFCQINIASAGACVPLTPSYYYLGTGYDSAGLCTAINSGIAAASLVDIVETQNVGVLKQVEQYAQDVLAAQNLIIQTEMMIRDLQENPLEVVVPDVNQIIQNQERINKLAQEIDKNSSSVGKNLINNLEHPNTIGLGQGSKFQLWSQARETAAKEAYDKVIGFTRGLDKKNKSITKAIKNIDHAQDKTATAKAAANVAGQQLTLLQEVKELLTQLLSLQAVESGAKLQAENDAALAQAKAAQGLGRGERIIIPDDTYFGPGNPNSKAF